MATCKHITTRNRRAALSDGGRYFDRGLGRWVCPWCDDWASAVAEAAALDEQVPADPGKEKS